MRELPDSHRLEPKEPKLGPAARPSGDLIEVKLALRPRAAPPASEAASFSTTEEVSSRANESRRFAEELEVDQDDIGKVLDFARKYDFAVEKKDINVKSGIVTLIGRPEAAAKAFGVDLAAYEGPAGHFYAHTQPATIASELEDVIEGIMGLDSRPTMLHRSRRHRPEDGSITAAPAPRSYTSKELAQCYDYPLELRGDGQCIGLIELNGGYDKADLDKYFSSFGIAPDIVSYNENESGDLMSNLEVTLDIELVAPICPSARVVLYNANSKQYRVYDYFKMFEAAIFDEVNRPAVLSTSWAFPEEYSQIGVSASDVAMFDRLFRQAAQRGITICAASGDTGSQVTIPARDSRTEATSLPVPTFPASHPLVLGCGGTTIEIEGPRIKNEIVWNRLGEWLDLGPSVSSGGASTGGISLLYDLPQYQRDFDVPSAVTTRFTSSGLEVQRRWGRGVPDVAANADLWTGYKFVFGGQWGVAGGTSSAAPMWAALFTLINQALGTRVGFVSPHLYALRQKKDVFGLINGGSNGAYLADPRKPWNPCTGLGSPKGRALLEALREALLP
jgi:kumamolisin